VKIEVSPEEVEELYVKLVEDAKAGGYHINPDMSNTIPLVEGLVTNAKRYGYGLCPCRLTGGSREADLDVICPCDYRDPDVMEFGACYCNLYVRKDIYESKSELQPVPERRPVEKQARAYGTASAAAEAKTESKIGEAKKEKVEGISEPKNKMWYCKQCGYVVFREDPPYLCPICKAKREMFEEIKTKVEFSG
jgi:ferredoxin-thioredoxin reductase catalytic chain